MAHIVKTAQVPIHTHTHTCTHAYTLMHIQHTCTHMHTHSTHMHMHTQTRIQHTCIHTCTHMYTYAHTHVHTCTCVHIHHTCAHKHTHIDTHMYPCLKVTLRKRSTVISATKSLGHEIQGTAVFATNILCTWGGKLLFYFSVYSLMKKENKMGS